MTDPDTLNHLTDYKNKLVDAVTKANYIWLQHIAERMNVTVNFTWRNTWGYRDKNGTWSGMIGLLDRGEIDFGGTGTFLVGERIGVVDYVQLYTPVGSRFLFRRPPLSYTSNLFTLPFDRIVWIAIGVLLILVYVLSYISMKWEWNKIEKKQIDSHLPGELESDPSLSDNFIVVLGAVSQQGFTYEPYTISSRIVVFVLLIAALSLYASYTANIVALLQSTSSSINTIQDLAESGLKIGVHDIVYNRYYFGSFKDPLRKDFYERFVENKSDVWMPLNEGIQQLRMGLFAFHGDSSCGYEIIQQTFEEHEKCGIHEIDYLKVLDPMLVIKRNSPYREIFRVGAQWVRETGLQKRDAPKLFTEKPICTSHASFVSVGTTECYAAFLTMGYGMTISFGLFLLEIIWNKSFGHDKRTDIETNDTPPEGNVASAELESID
uniref:Ionotropic receptor 75u n=1 Tax=Meteorus pulchricornis TaxID=51522 RepID=A0A1S5VFU7_9HYME|nr:ionotropic receptor 75u [Meteorus pulchricornis]